MTVQTDLAVTSEKAWHLHSETNVACELLFPDNLLSQGKAKKSII